MNRPTDTISFRKILRLLQFIRWWHHRTLLHQKLRRSIYTHLLLCPSILKISWAYNELKLTNTNKHASIDRYSWRQKTRQNIEFAQFYWSNKLNMLLLNQLGFEPWFVFHIPYRYITQYYIEFFQHIEVSFKAALTNY